MFGVAIVKLLEDVLLCVLDSYFEFVPSPGLKSLPLGLLALGDLLGEVFQEFYVQLGLRCLLLLLLVGLMQDLQLVLLLYYALHAEGKLLGVQLLLLDSVIVF